MTDQLTEQANEMRDVIAKMPRPNGRRTFEPALRDSIGKLGAAWHKDKRSVMRLAELLDVSDSHLRAMSGLTKKAIATSKSSKSSKPEKAYTLPGNSAKPNGTVSANGKAKPTGRPNGVHTAGAPKPVLAPTGEPMINPFERVNALAVAEIQTIGKRMVECYSSEVGSDDAVDDLLVRDGKQILQWVALMNTVGAVAAA